MSGASRNPRRILLVAGEASGDLHGSRLVRALLEKDPALRIFAVAGEKLKREGVEVVYDLERISGMGLTELAGSLKNLWQAYGRVKRFLRKERPELLILIDFPEFNMRLARFAKSLKIPVLYYISPQVWAWRKGRVEKIARRVDQMAVVFPFEAALYEKARLRVRFVGHPLLDIVRATGSRESTLSRYGLDPSKKTIALLPGSRRREVDYHLAPMLNAAERLGRQMDLQFILVRASTVERRVLEEALGAAPVKVAMSDGDTYNVLDACDLAWTASGTATLETALLLRPMIIIYRLSWLTYGLARLLVRVNHIGMINIIAGESVVPELIQNDVTPEKIVAESRRILLDHETRRRMVQKLAEVRQKLGAPGAAERVAEMALSMIG